MSILMMLLALALAVPLTAQPVAETKVEAGALTEKADVRYPMDYQLPAEAFHGEAYLTPLIRRDDTYNTPDANLIIFAPGSHSDWHEHGGMIVVALEGVGYYQAEGEAATVLHKGDIVQIPSGVRHWHGAVGESWFVQLVIYDSLVANTAGGVLSDNEYAHLATKQADTITRGDVMTFAMPEQAMETDTFSGKAWVTPLLGKDNAASCPPAFQVVFDKGVYNNWHSHAGGQILIATDGIIYHQIQGEPVQVLHPGDIAFCPPGTVHWHGGGKQEMSAHIAIECNPERSGVTWLDRIDPEQYAALPDK